MSALAEIERILEAAKRRKADSTIDKLDEQIQGCQDAIKGLSEQNKASLGEVTVFRTQRLSFDGKLKELQALVEFVEPGDYADALHGLTEKLAELDMEIEHRQATERRNTDQIKAREVELGAAKAERAKFPPRGTLPVAPPPALTPDQVELNESIVAVKQCGLWKLTAGAKFATFGGEVGRTSTQSLISFLTKALGLGSLTTYPCDTGDKGRVMASIRNGGVHCLIVFTKHSRHEADLYRLARGAGVKLVMADTFGKQGVLEAIANEYGIKLS